MGNPNQNIEEKTTQCIWPTEKVQKDKQRSPKHTMTFNNNNDNYSKIFSCHDTLPIIHTWNT